MDLIYILAFAFFGIAFLYSSVGFGGGSSYLVLLALFFTSIAFIRTTALLCNVIVVSGSVLVFYHRRLLDFKRFLPFILTSVPMAFLGARFRLTERTFFILLGVTLVLASSLLLYQAFKNKANTDSIPYPSIFAWILGAGIGFLAGLVGIGGGIFLAPILLLMKWDKPIKIAALASFFILVNSISGIIGLLSASNFEFILKDSLLLLIAVLVGGQLGIRTSLKWFNAKKIRVVTSILILIVAVRILIEQI